MDRRLEVAITSGQFDKVAVLGDSLGAALKIATSCIRHVPVC